MRKVKVDEKYLTAGDIMVAIEPGPNLSDKCEKYIKSSLAILASKGGLEIAKQRPRPNDIEPYVTTNTEYHNLIKYLKQDESLIKKYDEQTIKKFISVLLRKIVNKTESFEYNSNVFSEVYSEFESEIHAEKWTVRIIAPLINFEMDDTATIDVEGMKLAFKNYEIDFSFKIRKIPQNEIAEFLGGKVKIISNICIDCYYWVEKDSERAPEPTSAFSPEFNDLPHAILRRILTMLRLFKEGDVELENYYIKPISFLPRGLQYRFVPNVLRSVYQYKLSNSGRDDFIDFVGKIENVLSEALRKEGSDFLDFALRYYNFAKERETNEDKLIDYMIVFEALYLTDKAELAYRISNRVATLLGEDEQNRQEIFSNIKDSYNLRSVLVHGSLFKHTVDKKEFDKMGISLSSFQGSNINKFGKHYFKDRYAAQSSHRIIELSLQDEKIKNLFDEWYNAEIGLVEKYARLSLKRFLNLICIKNKKDILKDLDDSIFDSEKRRDVQNASTKLFN
ncbi:MAG: hypothetical protein KAU52_07410 [Methanosarcinales archaeon]|nr:hypothetical protein [Methanosarcinales archaeon]